MTAPGLYLDTVVQLSGQLRKQPIIICDSDLYSSPASWGLGEEGLVAAAGGFDQQVRSLLPGDLTMTVEGRWRRWEGPVGCGKQAQRQEVWYLAVDRILSPSPLAQVTLTPSSGVEISAVTAEPTAVSEPETTEEGEIPEIPTLDETPVPVEPTLSPEVFPEETVTPLGSDPNLSPTPSIEQTPQVSQTLTSTVPLTTTTPSAVGSATPGISQTPAGTLTVTPTGASSGSLVDKGDIYQVMMDSFMTDVLDPGTIDRWEIDLFEGETLHLDAIAPAPADIILSIYQDGQAVIDRQNVAPAGMPESINAPQLQGPGIFDIHVEVAGNGGTEYALAVNDDPTYPVSISGVITPGSPRNAVQLPESTIHLWFFAGTAGDVVAIRLKPVGNLDPAVDLYGPGAVYINTIDAEGDGMEEYRELPLTVTGLHALRIYEYWTEPMAYDLEITFP